MAILDFHDGGKPRFKRVAFGLAMFITFVVALTAIGVMMFSDIIRTATSIDDNRAVVAARTSLSSLREGLAGTVRDNAVWADAHAGVKGSNPYGWIYDNWGATSANYPLYDGMIVMNSDGSVFAGIHKGKPFGPSSYFRTPLHALLQLTLDQPAEAHSAFADTEGGIAVVAMQVIQSEDEVDPFETRQALVLYKLIDRAVLEGIRHQQSLSGLTIADRIEPGLLNEPIRDATGKTVALLSWRSADPGERLYEREKPLVALTILVLVLFVGGGAYLAYEEVRMQRRSALKAWALATHDALSGLFNRGGFLQMIERRREGRLAAPGALFLLDLDGFKAVNDNWGHPVGDALIRVVAAELGQCDPNIELIGRFGGDEFALYTTRADRAGAIAESVLALFRKPFSIRGLTIKVGVSIGVADAADGIGTDEMVRRADIALYEAKEQGKERAIIYDAVLGEQKAVELRLERDLRQAIEDGAIVPHFQPLFDARSRKIVGFEALARWNRPDDPITPDRFIALAERAGLMDQLGQSLLVQSLSEAAKWPAYTLSVNVSPLQLCNPRFPEQVKTALAKTGFDPGHLSMEVTEGALITNPDQARQAIHALKLLGISFALDDFGSGYASIGVLRQFGFDRIKIDRSLLIAADESDSGAAVIKATIALARALDVPVTAEGVERQEQADFLTQNGCDQLQGYLLGRPAAPAQIMRTLGGEDDRASLARAS